MEQHSHFCTMHTESLFQKLVLTSAYEPTIACSKLPNDLCNCLYSLWYRRFVWRIFCTVEKNKRPEVDTRQLSQEVWCKDKELKENKKVYLPFPTFRKSKTKSVLPTVGMRLTVDKIEVGFTDRWTDRLFPPVGSIEQRTASFRCVPFCRCRCRCVSLCLVVPWMCRDGCGDGNYVGIWVGQERVGRLPSGMEGSRFEVRLNRIEASLLHARISRCRV